MHFTVYLRGKDTDEADYSYGLIFVPSPVWIKGNEQILTLDVRPDYIEGSVARLIEEEKLGDKLKEAKCANILVHHIGHGTTKDLATLTNDLEKEGFSVQVYRDKAS